MPKPRNAWSKRLLHEVRLLIRRHATEHADEMTLGQVELFGLALSQLAAGIYDAASWSDTISGTDRFDEVLGDELRELPKFTFRLVDDELGRPSMAMSEDEGEPDWSIEEMLEGLDSAEPEDGGGDP